MGENYKAVAVQVVGLGRRHHCTCFTFGMKRISLSISLCFSCMFFLAMFVHLTLRRVVSNSAPSFDSPNTLTTGSFQRNPVALPSNHQTIQVPSRLLFPGHPALDRCERN